MICKCGKFNYDKRTAETVRNRRKRQGVKYLRIYQCPESGTWHLTSQTKDKKYATRRKIK